uniref:Transmembrane protein 192 n=1 Tax=Culicoides sonorensis TaxID=179676 RepID=A0A336MCV1_CULSO
MADGEPILSAEADTSFKKLKTVPLFSFHLLVSTAISFTGIVLAATSQDKDRCKAYFIMVYMRVAFWFITFIFDHLVKHHHDQLRMNGYHDFHRATNVQKTVPLYIVSAWSAVFLGVQTLMHETYGEDFWIKCIFVGFLSPVIYVTGFSVVETFILGIVHTSYICRVTKFNNAKPQPDALRGRHSSGEGLVGLTHSHADTLELLEKQADLINYLKDHNMRLSQKLMQLNSQVRTVTLPPQI